MFRPSRVRKNAPAFTMTERNAQNQHRVQTRKTAVPENASVKSNVKTDAEIERSGVEASLQHGRVSHIRVLPLPGRHEYVFFNNRQLYAASS